MSDIANIVCADLSSEEGELLTADNIYWEAQYEDWGETEVEDYSLASLWENIRKKKEREGDKYKPAKPGDKDRPDPEAWKKAQSAEDFKPHTMYDKEGNPHQAKTYEDHLEMKKQGYTHTKSAFKYEDPKTGEVYQFSRKGVYKKEGRPLVFKGKAEFFDYTKSADYQGKKVTLNKPFRTPDGPKKFAVYTKNGSGKVVIVRFGDPNMEIKKDNPARRKSFRARMRCDTPGPKWKARYWACKSW